MLLERDGPFSLFSLFLQKPLLNLMVPQGPTSTFKTDWMVQLPYTWRSSSRTRELGKESSTCCSMLVPTHGTLSLSLLPFSSSSTSPSLSPRIKDKHGSLVVDYLNPQDSETDQEIQQAINLAIAEFSLGGIESADIADDSDGEPGSGSGSESD
jgi:hypothetical protein